MVAEGVGFEPTVGFPTLDFESSALNRTQPPFLDAEENVERPTSNIQLRMQLSSTLGVQRWALEVERLYSGHPVWCLPQGRKKCYDF